MPDIQEIRLTEPERMLIKAIRRTEALPTNVDYATVERYEDAGDELMIDVSFWRRDRA